jgi:hypothetical protein
LRRAHCRFIPADTRFDDQLVERDRDTTGMRRGSFVGAFPGASFGTPDMMQAP